MSNIERRKKRILGRKHKTEKKKDESKPFVKVREGTFKEKWVTYFGHSGINPYDGATCVNCVAYIRGSCKGGIVPEYCVRGKKLVVHSYTLGSRSK
jgi:hypothetical protein